MQPRDLGPPQVEVFEGVVTAKKTAPPAVDSVAEAVRAELDALPGGLGRSGFARTAEVMARIVDDPSTPAAARVAAAKTCMDAMARLTGDRDREPVGDPLDDLAGRRASRRSSIGKETGA